MGKTQQQVPITSGSAELYVVWLEGFFAYLVVEVKNEWGLGGDPSLQGSTVCRKVPVQEKVRGPLLPHVKDTKKIKKRFALPHVHFTLLRRLKQHRPFLEILVVLFALSGDRLVVSTAIFTNSIYADELFLTRLYCL